MKNSMSELYPFDPSKFPEDLRHHIQLIKAAQVSARMEHAAGVLFKYNLLSPVEREAWANALLALYEANMRDQALLPNTRN